MVGIMIMEKFICTTHNTYHIQKLKKAPTLINIIISHFQKYRVHSTSSCVCICVAHGTVLTFWYIYFTSQSLFVWHMHALFHLEMLMSSCQSSCTISILNRPRSIFHASQHVTIQSLLYMCTSDLKELINLYVA